MERARGRCLSGRGQPSTAVSPCGEPTGFDWADPRERRNTVKIATDPTARNSDCQFWSVSCQKSELPRYWTQVIACSLCCIASWLKTLQPDTDWANQDAKKITPITISKDWE